MDERLGGGGGSWVLLIHVRFGFAVLYSLPQHTLAGCGAEDSGKEGCHVLGNRSMKIGVHPRRVDMLGAVQYGMGEVV